MDRFSELRAFAAVVEAGGFAAAARELGQSRSAVNRLVIALEGRLGVQLLHRTTRSVSATSTGRALYERARQLLGDLDEMERAVSSARTEPAGKLRISAPHSFGELDFCKLITAFMSEHRGVEIEVSFDSRLVDPVAEGFDVVIRVAEPDEQTSLVDHRVLELRYLLCAAPDYLAAHGCPSGPAALKTHRGLHLQRGPGDLKWSLFGPDGEVTVRLKATLIANKLDLLLAAALEGLGIAALPGYAVRADLAAGRLMPVLPGLAPRPRMLQVIYPPARHLSAKVRLFTDFADSWCAGRHPAGTAAPAAV